MILKYNIFTAAALVTQSYSFTASPSVISSRASTTLKSLNSDWDNKDFLSALGGNPNDLQKANADYEALSGANAKKNEWLAKSMQQSGGEQAGKGGGGGNPGPSPELLQKMGMQPGQQVPPPPRQQFQQPPPQQFAQQPPPIQQPVAQTQPQFYDQNGNPITTMPMIYDANGNLVPFNPTAPPVPQQAPQPIQQAQPGAPLPPQFVPVAEPPLPAKTKGTSDHRPVGYNADAYTMSNTADVYFAQLKQDSKVRKQAWLSGDVERANKVFDDDSVKQIGDSWVENPYTKEQNVKEAKAQIEGAVRMQVMGGEDDRGVNQVSHKKKLEEMKARKRGGGGAVSVPNPSAIETKQDAPSISPPNVENNLGTAPKVGGTAPTMPQGPPATSMTTSQFAPVQPASEMNVAAPIDDEEETRRKIRTLQGLLLKQRGGPGFGAGRLREPEAKRLESTLKEVTDILRSEAGVKVGDTAVAPPAVQSPAPKAAPAPVVQPPPQKLVAQAPPKPQSAPASSSADPIAGTVACVEAALKMYKEASSPAEREALLLPLREAFMAAAGASNKVIAENEYKAATGKEFGSAPSPTLATKPAVAVASTPPAQPVATQSSPMMGFPTSYNVAKAEPKEREIGYTAVGSDHNVKKLEDAYNALKEASGDGKFGLKNISGNEASQLAEKLTAMRGILLEELN